MVVLNVLPVPVEVDGDGLKLWQGTLTPILALSEGRKKSDSMTYSARAFHDT